MCVRELSIDYATMTRARADGTRAETARNRHGDPLATGQCRARIAARPAW